MNVRRYLISLWVAFALFAVGGAYYLRQFAFLVVAGLCVVAAIYVGVTRAGDDR